MQRKASYAAAYYKLLTSARSWRRESTPQHPAHTPSELFCGESLHRKVGSTRLAGLSPELILPQGCLGCRPPSGRWHLNWAGARPPTSLQEKNPSHLLCRKRRTDAQPAQLPGGLAAARGEPGGRRLPSWPPANSILWAPRRGGVWPSPYRPRLRPGFRPAHSAPGSAPAARTSRLVATASATLTPSCRVRGAAQLFRPLGPAEGPGRIHLHPQNPGA